MTYPSAQQSYGKMRFDRMIDQKVSELEANLTSADAEVLEAAKSYVEARLSGASVSGTIDAGTF